MEKLNVFVVSHKPLDLAKYPERKIIYVGKNHNQKPDFIRIFTDNTGDNIAELNPYYCELTALYWVWKNAPKSEYIGFEHYSRNFCRHFTRKFATLSWLYNQAKMVDMMHMKYSYAKTSCLDFWNHHEGLYLYPILNDSMKKLAPEYYDEWQLVMNGHYLSNCNIFICKWEIFDKYMKFLFKVLNDCFNKMKNLPQEQKLRSIGFMAERMLDAFMNQNKYNHKGYFVKVKKH